VVADSESPWEAEQINDRRLELLRKETATAPHEGGAWTDKDPPSELQALIDAVITGHGIDLYRRI
jgi:hypothetical protein